MVEMAALVECVLQSLLQSHAITVTHSHTRIWLPVLVLFVPIPILTHTHTGSPTDGCGRLLLDAADRLYLPSPCTTPKLPAPHGGTDGSHW